VTVRKELPFLLRVWFRSRRSRHIQDIQFFNGYRAKAVYQLPSGLMMEVMPLVADTLMGTSDDLLRFLAFWRAMLVLDLVELAAGLGECLLFFAVEPGIFDELPVGQSGELLQPNVDTNLFLGNGKQLGFDDTGHTGEPLSVLTPNGGSLGSTRKRAMNDSLEKTYLGEKDGVSFYLITIAVLFPGEAIIRTASLLARRLRTFLLFLQASDLLTTLVIFQPSKVGVEGKINTEGNVLKHMGMNRGKLGMLGFEPG
jgi:hypothetical protein